MPLEPELLSILACPEDKGPLYYIEDLDVLFNPRLQRVYRIREGIPVMLIDEAQRLEPSEAERLYARVQAEQIPPTFSDAAGSEAAGSEAAGEAAGAAAVPNRGFIPERRDPGPGSRSTSDTDPSPEEF